MHGLTDKRIDRIAEYLRIAADKAARERGPDEADESQPWIACSERMPQYVFDAEKGFTVDELVQVKRGFESWEARWTVTRSESQGMGPGTIAEVGWSAQRSTMNGYEPTHWRPRRLLKEGT